jgi:CheY-like chemotaxis protein
VSDTGAGIEPALLAELFEPFVQGQRTLARTEGGLGLGLALVKGVAELHGGTVAAESAGPGMGSTFRVRLPRHPLAERPQGGSPVARIPSSGRTVLVVDDHRDAADSLAQVVTIFGHKARVAYDAKSAIDLARVHRPDVVLCDIGLPGMNGYEVARALRAQRDDVRLIAVSGYARPEDAAHASLAGFDDYITKPADPETIRRVLA